MIRVTTWNVRLMFESGKITQATREMERYNLDILGVNECRWSGAGRKTTRDSFTITCGIGACKQQNHQSTVL